MSSKKLFKVANLELAAWDRSKTMPRGLAMAILFCFIHRLTTGDSFEQTFMSSTAVETDYEI